jgi:hypothetical protein
MAKYSYKRFSVSKIADIGPWHTEPDYDVKPNKNFDMVAAAARELAKEIEQGTLNKDSWMSVMIGIYEANGYQHPTTQEAKQAMEMAQQIVLNGQRGEGSPNIFNRKVYDQPRLDDLAETQMDWTPMPEGLAEKLPGWGEFPSGWDHPAFNPGRMRWGSTKTADKLHDFLMNPKSRPDLQTPEAQEFLNALKLRYHNEKTDALMPWLTREWKKGRIRTKPSRDPLRLENERFATPELSWQIPVIQFMEESERHPGEYREAIPNVERTYAEKGEDANQHFVYPDFSVRDINHMGDFLNSNHPLKREMGDIMQHQVPAFKQRIRDWDKAMEEEAERKRAEKRAISGETVHQWPDGWTIKRLHTPEELRDEGDVMGHCVGNYGDEVRNGSTSIYSLRDPAGVSHVTTEIQPHYVMDESGHRHKKDFLEGPFESHEVIPEHGEVRELQGRGNSEPKDEYKQRMREWFNTFPEDTRPQWGEKRWFEDGGEYLTEPKEIEPHHLALPDEKGLDEYGLRKPPAEHEVDWEKMLQGNQHSEWGRHESPHDEMQKVYELARARNEIPQLANEAEYAHNKAMEDFDSLEEMNHDWLHSYTGPNPEFMEPEEIQEHYGLDPTSPDYNDALSAEQDDWFQREQEARDELAENHESTQRMNALYQHLNDHYREGQGYVNLPLPKTTFSWQI